MLQADSLTVRSDCLAAHSIESPGRAIFNIQRVNSSLFILGDNQLLATYKEGRVESLLPPGRRHERVYKLWYAGIWHGELLVSGFYGVEPVVAILRDGSLSIIQAPTLRDTAAQLVSMNDDVYLVAGGLWRREEAKWSLIARGSDTDPFVYFGGEPKSRRLAITERGHCRLLKGAEWSIAGRIA